MKTSMHSKWWNKVGRGGSYRGVVTKAKYKRVMARNNSANGKEKKLCQATTRQRFHAKYFKGYMNIGW